MLGMGARSKTPQNLLRTYECVLNLPAASLVGAVNRLAKLTGSDPVPQHKVGMGYRFERDKFAVAGLTTAPADLVGAPRIVECAVQLEAVLEKSYAFGHAPDREPRALGMEVRIIRAHVDEEILLEGAENRIDPDRWRPLMMCFCEFYGLGAKLHASRLAEIPEAAYPASCAHGLR